MGKLMDRLMGLLGYQEDAGGYEETAAAVDPPESREFWPRDGRDEHGGRGAQGREAREARKRGRLVSLPAQTAGSTRVVICEIRRFEEVQTVADHLKNRRMVIASVVSTEREAAKRAVDFLSGAVYALDGGVQKIGEGVFLFTPENVAVDNENSPAPPPDGGIFV